MQFDVILVTVGTIDIVGKFGKLVAGRSESLHNQYRGVFLNLQASGLFLRGRAGLNGFISVGERKVKMRTGNAVRTLATKIKSQ